MSNASTLSVPDINIGSQREVSAVMKVGLHKGGGNGNLLQQGETRTALFFTFYYSLAFFAPDRLVLLACKCRRRGGGVKKKQK